MAEKKERLMVSNPRSAFGIYLPDTLIEFLGGMDAPVRTSYVRLDDGSYRFHLKYDKKAKTFIRKTGGSTHKGRMMWRDPYDRPIRFRFDKEYLLWDYDGDGIFFILPPKNKLRKPSTKSLATVKQPLLPLEGKSRKPCKGVDEVLEKFGQFAISLESLLKDPVIADRIRELSGK